MAASGKDRKSKKAGQEKRVQQRSAILQKEVQEAQELDRLRAKYFRGKLWH